ncbi:hypothetical protein J31TS3_27350 [Paenibacillus lactis]|nr:hypothetical protein [Paenibacillus lactis]GIO91508.1 hypothetical protein J31TS3_27350 [Paenibacillus lactis]
MKYARFDKGFGGEEFYSLWEGKNIGYVGKLKRTQRLAAQVQPAGTGNDLSMKTGLSKG